MQITVYEGKMKKLVSLCAQDVVLGDYEIEVLTGKNFRDRELLATLPIRIR